ncbi:hypothetical protein [Streptomyces aurantiogriseus]|nr:hypothetical protein [Streptomyces aurantiogriseus]
MGPLATAAVGGLGLAAALDGTETTVLCDETGAVLTSSVRVVVDEG